MLKLDFNDFQKILQLLEKESLGTFLSVYIDQNKLVIKTLDKNQLEMEIEIFDVERPIKPKVKTSKNL